MFNCILEHVVNWLLHMLRVNNLYVIKKNNGTTCMHLWIDLGRHHFPLTQKMHNLHLCIHFPNLVVEVWETPLEYFWGTHLNTVRHVRALKRNKPKKKGSNPSHHSKVWLHYVIFSTLIKYPFFRAPIFIIIILMLYIELFFFPSLY